MFLGSQSDVSEGSSASREKKAQAALARLASLSRRQREVLGGMAAGRRNKEIANQLGITERTVKMHRAAAITTLEVQTSVEAIRLAVEAGWTDTLQASEPI